MFWGVSPTATCAPPAHRSPWGLGGCCLSGGGGGRMSGGGILGSVNPPPIGLHVADGVLFLRGGGRVCWGVSPSSHRSPCGLWGYFLLWGGYVGECPPHIPSVWWRGWGGYGVVRPPSPPPRCHPAPIPSRPPAAAVGQSPQMRFITRNLPSTFSLPQLELSSVTPPQTPLWGPRAASYPPPYPLIPLSPPQELPEPR